MINFERNLISVFEDKYNWKEAAKLSAKKLLENKYITNEFIEKMIEYVEEFGPYIVLAPGIALFHARPEDGVIKQGISLNLFRPGVEFGVLENDPVYIIFVLAAVDNNSHIKLLSELSEILKDKKILKKIRTSKNENEIYKLLIK